MSERPRFLFITCQVGAPAGREGRDGPPLAGLPVRLFAPGFLTFKLPDDCRVPPDFKLGAVFARAYGFSLGPVTGDDPDVLARGVWTMFAARPWDRIHVWERDAASPGEHDFEPGLTAAAAAAHEALARNCPDTGKLALKGGDVCTGDSPIFAANSLTPRATLNLAPRENGTVPGGDWQQPRGRANGCWTASYWIRDDGGWAITGPSRCPRNGPAD